jgi:hypothetical protein
VFSVIQELCFGALSGLTSDFIEFTYIYALGKCFPDAYVPFTQRFALNICQGFPFILRFTIRVTDM